MSNDCRSSSSSSSDSEGEDQVLGQVEEETWEDWTEQTELIQSLFSEEKFNSIVDCLNNDKTLFGFDLVLICSTLG